MSVRCHISVEGKHDPVGTVREFLAVPRVGERIDDYGEVVNVLHFHDQSEIRAIPVPAIVLFVKPDLIHDEET